jgi:hypothetical protein
MPDSASRNMSSDIAPARTSSLKRHTSVPLPMSLPQNLPLSMGPPDTSTVGTPTLAAPINGPGVVLSVPPDSGLESRDPHPRSKNKHSETGRNTNRIQQEG